MGPALLGDLESSRLEEAADTPFVMVWWSTRVGLDQCDISVGTVIVRSISRVTPPRMPSCRRECP